MKYDWNIDKVKEAVANSCNYCEALRFLGIPKRGRNIETLKRKIEKNGLDVSHFTGKSRVPAGAVVNHKKYAKDYLYRGSAIKTSTLKQKLIESGLKLNVCEICGITQWMFKPISLQLHHINGDKDDNRLENLQILCPNCHSQTDNFCGKSAFSKPKKVCAVCGKTITKCSTYCKSCAAKIHASPKAFSDEELFKEYQRVGTNVAVAAKFGYSDSLVSRRIRAYMKKLGLK